MGKNVQLNRSSPCFENPAITVQLTSVAVFTVSQEWFPTEQNTFHGTLVVLNSSESGPVESGTWVGNEGVQVTTSSQRQQQGQQCLVPHNTHLTVNQRCGRILPSTSDLHSSNDQIFWLAFVGRQGQTKTTGNGIFTPWYMVKFRWITQTLDAGSQDDTATVCFSRLCKYKQHTVCMCIIVYTRYSSENTQLVGNTLQQLKFLTQRLCIWYGYPYQFSLFAPVQASQR